MIPEFPAANEGQRARERLLYIVPGLAALLVITLFGLAYFILGKSREARLDDAGRTARSLVQVVEQRAARLLGAVDLSLRGSGEMWREIPALHDPASPAMHALLARTIAGLPHARTLFFLDAHGVLRQDSDLHPATPKDFSNREFFNWPRSHPEGLYVGKPAFNGADAPWFLVVSRRLNDAQGGFAGVIGVALEQDAFRVLLRDIDTGGGGAIRLLYRNGELIASEPPAPSWLGMSTGTSFDLKDLQSKPEGVTFRHVSAIDGNARIYSVRQIMDTPLLAEVGLGEDDVLAGWREEKSAVIAILSGLALAVGAATWLLLRDLRRVSQPAVPDQCGATVAGVHLPAEVTERERHDRRKAIRDPAVSLAENQNNGWALQQDRVPDRQALVGMLHESEARYRALFQHSIDAVFLMRPDGSVLSANAQACRLLGYTQSELRVLGRQGLTDPADPRVATLLEEHRRGGNARGELRMRRKDGSWVPVEVSSTTFRDRSGAPCASLIVRDITDRKRAEEHIEYLAYYDELTGIPNRAHFQRAFEQAIAIHQRQGLKSALMVVDLDRFKNINDIIGHEAGDQLLKQVAARLRTCLRDEDVLARLGGDEFVILMQDASSMEAISAVANKILKATARPLVINEQEFLITASIGISTSPLDGADLQTLLRNADVAMYRAKESGKNAFQYFSPEMDARGRERLTIESAMGRALERSEFMLHFQPKILVASGNVAGMEALVRWQNPEKGLMLPGEFIGIAEETGMIVPIGDWVLTEACRHAQALRCAGHENLRVAVNLSVRQLYDESLALRVSGALERTGFPAENLELEITESMVMRDAEGAIKMLHALRDTGVRVAIDDFGTGYSSLAYLKRFPLDCVKIDRSFIRDLPDDHDDASITRSIIAMAHNMKLEVVAEGVETMRQFEFLHTCGCDEIQGFLFSEPLRAEAFERFLDDPNPPSAHPLPA